MICSAVNLGVGPASVQGGDLVDGRYRMLTLFDVDQIGRLRSSARGNRSPVRKCELAPSN
jgi:hypothetical protein